MWGDQGLSEAFFVMTDAIFRFLLTLGWFRVVLGAYLGRLVVRPGYVSRRWEVEPKSLGGGVMSKTTDALNDSVACIYSQMAMQRVRERRVLFLSRGGVL